VTEAVVLPVPRTRPVEDGTELETMTGLLDFLRVAEYRAECDRSRDSIRAANPETRARSEGMTFTLRYALAHMIEETARHYGHLDLLRESLDGQTGE
jgi:Protein of unknown function (DUF664)